MGGWKDGLMEECTHGWMDGRTEVQMDGCMDEQTDEYLDRRRDGRTWMNTEIDGEWTDGWMDELTMEGWI
jgi:hypothetical protein